MKKINVNVLENTFKKIIEKLQFDDISEIEVPYDMYRIIPTDKWMISETNKEEVHIGSLYDDVESLEKLMLDKNGPCTYVDFDRVSSILRIISEVQNPA